MSADGKGQIGHVGGVHLRPLAERTGLTCALSGALQQHGFHPLHDREQVLVDPAVAITLGAHPRHPTAAAPARRDRTGRLLPTVWRTLKEANEAVLRKTERDRAAVRRHVWQILANRPEGFPEVTVDGVELTGWTVIHTDGSLASAPSEKDGAHGTYKGTYGHQVFVAMCDNTGGELAQLLHPGNTTANDTGVNIDLLEAGRLASARLRAVSRLRRERR